MNKLLKYSFLLSFSFVLFSCKNYESLCNKFESQISEVRWVTIKIIESGWAFEGDIPEKFSNYDNLLSEEELRASNCVTVDLPGENIQTNYFLALLYSAKKINAKDNKPKVKNADGLKWFWQEGIIIDVYYNDLNRPKDVYVMQNGKHIFYKKGEEDIYYKMPSEILNKYRF